MKRLLTGLIACTLTAASMPSLGATPKPVSEASRQQVAELMLKAIALREQNRPHEALEVLNQALAISLDPQILQGLGRVYEDLGRYEEARTQYIACLAETVHYKIRDAAKEGLKRIEAATRTGTLSLSVRPVGATLVLNGRPAELGDGSMVLPPGTHRVRLELAGYVAHDQDVVVVGGKTTTVAVELQPVIVEVREVPMSVAARDPGVDFGAWPWVTLGLGLGLAGAGAWFVVDGQNDWDAVTGEMPRAQADELVDRGSQKRTAGFVGLGVGGGLVVTSMVLWLLEREPSEGATVVVLPSGKGMSAALTWSF
jgi:hypothetical protein